VRAVDIFAANHGKVVGVRLVIAPWPLGFGSLAVAPGTT
jgi:hypothetical protein